MCEQCAAATEDYGNPLPGLLLVRATRDGNTMKAGQWGLVECDSPFLIFNIEPQPDPAHEMSDAEIEDTDDAHPLWAWLEQAGEFNHVLLVEPRIGHRMIEEAKVQGYTEKDGYFAHWLFHRMGALVVAHKQGSEDATPA